VIFSDLKQRFRNWSAQLSLSKSILIISILPLLVEALLLAFLFRVYSGWKEADKWVGHSQEILIQAAHFQKEVLEARIDARSYALFGEQVYVESLKKEMQSYRKGYNDLRKLVSDNESQLAALSGLDADLLSIDAYYSAINFEARGETQKIAQVFSFTKQGETLINSLFEKLDILVKTELLLGEKRKVEQQSRVTKAAIVVGIGGLILLALTLFVGFAYQLAVKERFKELMQSLNGYFRKSLRPDGEKP